MYLQSNSHQQAILFTKMAESFAMILLNCDKKKKDDLFLVGDNEYCVTPQRVRRK